MVVSSKLGPIERQKALDELRDPAYELDVLVIGGGITGAGAALDAATRGLSTGLVESRDWGFGTSSRSSKLVHGGIRYLEQMNFALVREALTERGLLLQKIAPHLVRPVRFLYPVTKPIIERLYVGAGMFLYDIFARTGGRPPGVPWHRHISRKQLRKDSPSLKPFAHRGGLTYSDALVDDARYVANLVRTAAAYGAHVVNRLSVEDFLKVGERVVGVRARDLMTDEMVEIYAKQVVNATGVWTGELQKLVGERATFSVRASKGIHLVVPRDRFRSKYGLLLRTEKSVLFVIPWGRHWLIGTTDTDWNLDLAHPAATATDIQYLLEQVNKVLKTPLNRDDVEGVFAGLRPLLAGESDETSKLSREHLVTQPVPGLVMVAGGKWTTYRVMAKDAIDTVVDSLDGKFSASITENVPLVGAEGYQAFWNKRKRIARAFTLHEAHIEHLLKRYGSLTGELLEMLQNNPKLAEVLPATEDYLGVEVVYAATHEGALHLDDVFARRTRISIEAWDRGVSAAPVAASLMGEVLGWSKHRIDTEIEHYKIRVEAEISSQQQTTDEGADRIRLSAPEPSFKGNEDD